MSTPASRHLVRIVAALVALDAAIRPRIEGDTEALVGGALELLRCSGGPCPQAQHFPLAQYVPSVLLLSSGLTPAEVLRALAVISGFALAAVLILGFEVLGTYPWRAGLVFVLAVVGSPVLFYGGSSFGESLAALLILVAVQQAAVGGELRLPVFLACLTKEIAWAPLLVLVLIATTGTKERGRRRWGALVGAGAAIMVGALFNRLRFGTWSNAVLTQPELTVPTVAQWASNAAALLFSPAGGLVWFAPLACALLGLVWLQYRQGAILGCLVVLGFLIAGFARWFAPFGWVAWGPRLLVPWLPAVIFLVLWRYSDALEDMLEEWKPLWLRVPLVLSAVGLTLPQLVAGFETSTINVWFRLPTDLCPSPADVLVDAGAYYRCLNEAAWSRFDLLPFAVLRASLVEHPIVALALAALHLRLWRELWRSP